MAYCSKCGVEYVEGVTHCAECGATLSPGSAQTPPPESQDAESDENVCVRVFRGLTARMEADLARNVLEQEGIPCVLPGEVMAGILPDIDVVQLFVRKEDSEQAAEILEGFFDSPHPLPPDENLP